MDFHGKLFKNKYWEIELRRQKDNWQWLLFSLYWSRKQDHAGLHFMFEVLGFSLDINLYDSRHWNYEKDSWEEDEEVDEAYEAYVSEAQELRERIEIALRIATETHDSDLIRCQEMIKALEGIYNGGGN